jgi:hypothetical protein
MWLGTASTGAAIAGLSGAAATNATLAFLGGGSLAAGGLGMAGGAMMLGGLVAGPALAIMGLIIGAKATDNLEKAKTNYEEAKKAAEELVTLSVACNDIRRRAATAEFFAQFIMDKFTKESAEKLFKKAGIILPLPAMQMVMQKQQEDIDELVPGRPGKFLPVILV